MIINILYQVFQVFLYFLYIICEHHVYIKYLIDEFNRSKKNPFEQKFFPFYEFPAPEIDIMVQFLEPETDIMVQFMAPKIVIMGKRNYIAWL